MKIAGIHLNLLIITLIIATAIILRFYKLGEIPKGFYVDEAGQGYSAYSILKTGKDEFSKPFPIVFRSLTDFKTPVYIYLIVPLIPIFGLNPFTVRLPSFIFSIASIPVLYLLIKRLSGNNNLSLIVAFLLSISPWHILFGRTNFECNVALFFYICGLFMFFESLAKPKFLIFSAVMFAIAIPAYHSQRIITPLTLIFLAAKYGTTITAKSHLRYLILGIIIGTIILLPTISIALTPGFLARASGLNIFSHARQMPDGYLYNYQGIFSTVVNSSWYLTTREFLSLYFSYLSPRYMFILGDYGARSSFPELSTFYLWQFPFYLYGLFILTTKKISSDFKHFLFFSLLISPIPAALTRDPYTTIRSIQLLIPQLTIIALGIYDISKHLRNNFAKTFAFLFVLCILIYSIAKLYSSVFILNEYYRAKAWDYGWSQVVEKINSLDTGLPIIVDNARADSYPQLAFYLKYPPEKYQKENFETDTGEYYTNMKHNPNVKLGNISVRAIDWKSDLAKDQYLIADELGISLEQIQIHKLTLVSQINYPDGTPAYRITRTNPKYFEEEQILYSKTKKALE